MECTERTNNKYFLYFSVFSVNLLSILTGATNAWPSTNIPKLFNITTTPLSRPTTTEENAWIAALPFLGTVLSPILASFCSQKIGKKKTLLIFGIPMVVAQLLYIFAVNVDCFLFGAFLSGLTNGCVFTVLPVFVGEVAENKNRGVLSAVMAILINLGILMGYALGPFVTITQLSWILLAIAVTYFVLFGFFVPETPYYFISNDNRQLAEESLRKLRNDNQNQLEKELFDITAFVKATSKEEISFSKILKSRAIRKGFFITNCLAFIQQFSGIGAVQSYMETIFAATESSFPPQYSVIIVGSLQFLTNVISSSFVDSLGRRLLLLISKTLSFIALFTLATYFYLLNNNYKVDSLSWLPILCLAVFVMAFNAGLSTVPWIVMGEIFPSVVKPSCTMFLVSITFIYAFLITMCFPFLNAALGIAGTFWIFSSILGIGILFSGFVMMETKGKSFHEIQDMLNGHMNKPNHPE